MIFMWKIDYVDYFYTNKQLIKSCKSSSMDLNGISYFGSKIETLIIGKLIHRACIIICMTFPNC